MKGKEVVAGCELPKEMPCIGSGFRPFLFADKIAMSHCLCHIIFLITSH